MLNSITDPNINDDQFMVIRVTELDGGQKEKKIPIIVYPTEKILMGSPHFPSWNGPHSISRSVVRSRLISRTTAAIKKEE